MHCITIHDTYEIVALDRKVSEINATSFDSRR